MKKGSKSGSETAADVLNVGEDFIEESKKANLVRPRQKFAPYTKEERMERRKEVYRLHFERGMPATKIASLMSVDRNTINNDIQTLYKQLKADNLNIEFSDYYTKQMIRLEAQRGRLMGYLEKAELDQKITIERLLTDVDIRMLLAAEKAEHGSHRVLAQTMEDLNQKMEDAGQKDRYITLDTVIGVSNDGWKVIRGVLQKEGVLKK